MAYDVVLAERMREVAGGAPEKRMFGSVAFCLGEQIAVAVRGQGLLVRVGKDGVDAALRVEGVQHAVMGTREMHGWVSVPSDLLADSDLAYWWRIGVEAALAASAS